MPRPLRRIPPAQAMIVAPQPEAVEAGTEVLAQGGSAVDAVLACAFTQGVVDPMMCGIGGLGSMQVFDPATGTHTILDGLSTCPGAATPEMWHSLFERECADGYGYVLKGAVNELGHKAVTTPGILRVFEAAHARFGRLDWSRLFQPAIGFAEEGWMIRPHVAAMFTMNEAAYGRRSYADKLSYTADGTRLYMRDGAPKRVGDPVRNPELAATLRELAAHGAESFFTGDIARRIIADMAAHGGLLSAADLAGFRIREHPEYIRVIAEAMKIAGRDKETHLGDPAFVTPPLDMLLSDTYADACAARIASGEKTALPRVGGDAKHTTTISCVDGKGQVVSLTHTLGTPSGVMPPGMGFMLNGAMNWYDPRPDRAGSIAPGKRRFSSMSPTIVLEGNTPVVTLGAPGGAWIGVAILQVLLNLLEWGMTMQEAVQAPRFSATTDAIDISNRIPRSVQRTVEAMGYEVRRSPMSFPFAAPHGITTWDGSLQGGADPQRDGYVGMIATQA